ncbi:response regulator [Candidatus Omnitrophota bacterium]
MKPKILIVDDDWAVLMKMQKLLFKDGFEVKIAFDSSEAKELVCRENFDIIYTNMSLSWIDGADLCKIVKTISPQTIVIVFSGSPQAMMDRLGAFLANGGMDLYLRKPLTNEEIVSSTYRALQKRERKKILSYNDK